ncbi:MAG: LPS export ABC transporter periplasmic protein LptC [Bacteroidetes bacterium]|nr:LPS export ABC transporter periplasmic protein LptC [Bacteroidota bacterium]
MVCKKKVFLTPGNHRLFLPVLVLFLFHYAIFFSGCGNDLQTVNDIVHEYTAPVMSAKTIEVTFSDSGKIQAKLFSPLINRYEGEDPRMEFPQGFKVFIYDSAMRVETTITGAWGKRMENIKMMEARGNVVVRNEIKNQQLNTEHLFWDEKKARIYSDVKSKITTSDKVFYVEGLESNESFTNYTFTHLTGEMTVRKDSI